MLSKKDFLINRLRNARGCEALKITVENYRIMKNSVVSFLHFNESKLKLRNDVVQRIEAK